MTPIKLSDRKGLKRPQKVKYICIIRSGSKGSIPPQELIASPGMLRQLPPRSRYRLKTAWDDAHPRETGGRGGLKGGH
jgi:hypothetical protein